MKAETSFVATYKTLLVIVIGFAVLSFVFKLDMLLWIGLGIGILGLISNFLAEWVEKLWILLGKALGYIVPNIIMTLIFYGLLFPMAVLYRLFRKNDLLKLKNKGTTTFIEKKHRFVADDFEHMF